MPPKLFRREIIVRASPLRLHWGMLQAGPLRMRCALGRSGRTFAKREGDGATPIGTMRPVRLPFPASAERMLRPDRLYDAVVVLDWNVRSRGRGRGSAIFLHVATPGYGATEGCVAVSPADFRRLEPFLTPSARLTVPVQVLP